MASTSMQYASGTISVQNALPGQKITVSLSNASQVCWSSGQALATGNGINLTSVNGSAIPVSSFKIAGNVLELLTASSSGGSTIAFNVNLFVAATAGTPYIQLSSSAPAGTVVTFAFSGSKAVTLSQTSIPITWPS